MSLTINNLIKELENLDRGNLVESAQYRQEAQNILGDPSIALNLRTIVSDVLLQANQQLMLKTVTGDDSY